MPFTFNPSIHKLDIVIEHLTNFAEGAPAHLNKLLVECMTLDVLPRWYNHIQLQDHSLEDLAKLGHPYSVRFPVDSFMHPDSEVHKQSGSFFEATKIEVQPDVVLLHNYDPHYIFLRYGTTHMRLRDPGGEAMGEALPDIQKRFHNGVRDAIILFFPATGR